MLLEPSIQISIKYTENAVPYLWKSSSSHNSNIWSGIMPARLAMYLGSWKTNQMQFPTRHRVSTHVSPLLSSPLLNGPRIDLIWSTVRRSVRPLHQSPSLFSRLPNEGYFVLPISIRLCSSNLIGSLERSIDLHCCLLAGSTSSLSSEHTWLCEFVICKACVVFLGGKQQNLAFLWYYYQPNFK
jgi:hypothetical protein